MSRGVFFWSCLVLLLSVLLFSRDRSWRAWLLLFSGDRAEALEAWKTAAPLNTKVVYPLRPIAEIQAVGE